MTDNYLKIISYDSLLKAHKRARLSKQHKKEVILFETHLSENLWSIHNALKYGTYEVSSYHTFKIYDPKEREIQAISYRDRVVQHSICDNYLIPLLERHLIYDNGACRKNKGTLFTLNRLKLFMEQHYKKNKDSGYFIKLDIKKYFPSINHDVLKSKLNKLIKEEDILELLYKIIDSYNKEENIGLPMGNQTSQCFALLYLDNIDRYIKEVLRIKHYVRYMDDMILLVDGDKEKAKIILDLIKNKILENKIETNEKSQIISVRQGITLLGWRFFYSPNGKVIRVLKRQTRQRIKNKVAIKIRKYFKGELTKQDLNKTYVSYRGHLKHLNGHNELMRIKEQIRKKIT